MTNRLIGRQGGNNEGRNYKDRREMQGISSYTAASSGASRGAGNSVIVTSPRFKGYGEDTQDGLRDRQQKETARLCNPEGRK